MKTEKHTVAIHTEYIKLEALLKYMGITATGGEAKEIIREGAVSVDGEVCTQRGKKLYPGCVVRLENFEITVRAEE